MRVAVSTWPSGCAEESNTKSVWAIASCAGVDALQRSRPPVAFGVGPETRRINHLMIEVDNFDDVGLTYDLVRKNKVPVTITPGKHSNDHMYSFYMRNPSGWIIEYGCGGRPATHSPNTTPKTSVWPSQ